MVISLKLLHKTLEFYTKDIITILLILNWGLIVVLPDFLVTVVIQRASFRLILLVCGFYFGTHSYDKYVKPSLVHNFIEVTDEGILYHAITSHTRDIMAIFLTVIWIIGTYLPESYYGEVAQRSMEQLITIVLSYYFGSKKYKNDNDLQKPLTHTN